MARAAGKQTYSALCLFLQYCYSCLSHVPTFVKKIFIRFFPSISESIGMHVGFFIFCGCCVAAFFFTLFVVPETKGKSFQEIQAMLGAEYVLD